MQGLKNKSEKNHSEKQTGGGGETQSPNKVPNSASPQVPTQKPVKAVFLDRDGVINQLILRNGKAQAPYTLEEFALLPRVNEACLQLKENGFLLIVVTNQPDVARGWVAKEFVDLVNDKVKELLPVDAIHVCWHTNDHQCDCRKPLPGMLKESAKDWNICLEASFMVGDRYGDVAAGKAAGCTTILVGQGDAQGAHPDPDFRADSLFEALPFLLSSKSTSDPQEKSGRSWE